MLAAAAAICCCLAKFSLAAFRLAFLLSSPAPVSLLGFFGRSTKVPFILAITSESVFEYCMRCFEHQKLVLAIKGRVFRLHHWFVVKGKSLHRPEGICRAAHFLENDKRLASHFQRFEGDNVVDGAKLGENGI